jgi:hypothetical protein
VLRIWEHEIGASSVAAKLRKIKKVVQQRAALPQLARGRAS